MRFKAKITNPASCVALFGLVSTYRKISGSRVARLRLTPRKLCFIVTQEALGANTTTSSNDGIGQPQVWAEANQEALFEEYKIESLHENNEIVLDLSLEHLARALKSAERSSHVVLKLTKEDDMSFLAINIGSLSSNGLSRPITHSVPVSLARPQAPPPLPPPDATVHLPLPRVLRHVVERIRAVNHVITVQLNREGVLALAVQGDGVSVRTAFRDLRVPAYREGHAPPDSQQGSPSDFITARVDGKKLAHFVSGHLQSNWPDALLCIAKDQCVLLFLRQDDMCISYMIPILSEQKRENEGVRET